MIRHIKNRIGERNDEGFTLIELLIVIVILGILGGVVTFGVSSFRSDAQASCTATNQKLVATATSAYQAKHGAGTVTVDQLVAGGYLGAAPGTC
jgi:prepilin-type N-terminal cleavage/methylation domain-containing protein